ncbi:YifB family Mg chelatase-like AAA ATPase [Bacillus fonticola]|uniref:YifB family Mg chelatase-like AAA ATPase n=1 Tax=Bacillus fonticola TaxID=2728853 RepID=UPI001474A4D6|nr:YifB family Mg chelatase-like AAA ATPase [Bacillus fonticola]
MATVITSVGLKGLEGYRVHVEVQIIPGVEGVTVVGLPDAAVKESKDRVMAALFANDCVVPDQKVVINLSPAEQRKNSPIFDVAMAVGIMKEAGYIHDPIPEDVAFLGVLSLDGSIRPVEGMLPAILAAKNEKIQTVYLPYTHDFPLTHLEGIELRFIQTLSELTQVLSGQMSFTLPTSPVPVKSNSSSPYTGERDFHHILGHSHAKRALEIAAAGGHNVLMSGPPGCGKSLLAETFPSIFPALTQQSQLEVISIYQLAGHSNPIVNRAPFRSPHHSSSAVSLIGGGSHPKPGEVSLAHHGVLFLDEMAEFPKRTLDMLRQPIESGKVTISRAASTVTYPTRFLLLGAMNPCPCGFLGARNQYCTCSQKQIQAYQNRVSGPIKDRMDILLTLQPISMNKESIESNEWSKTIRHRVIEARRLQAERYGREETNATVSFEDVIELNPLTPSQQSMLHQRSANKDWSNRVQVKVIRLARTISDLQGKESITDEALWEAMTLRRSNINNNQSIGGVR